MFSTETGDLLDSVKLPPYFQPHFFVDTDVYQMLFHSDLLHIIGGDAIFLPQPSL